MSATQTQLRRGTNAQCVAMTPANAEPIVDLTNKRLNIGDGTTLGGIPHVNYMDALGQKFTYAIDTGAVNALVLTFTPALLAWNEGVAFEFKPAFTNTGTATVNPNGIGAKTFKKVVGGVLTDLTAGDLIAGVIYRGRYDGTNVQVSLATGALSSVSQGDLNSSTGIASFVNPATGTPYSATLPGGEYGFYPQINKTGAGGAAVQGFLLQSDYTLTTSYITKVGIIRTGAGGVNINFLQRYINASPPFDLGDGEVGGFVFLLLNENGDIQATYSADVPPWAYNGPTSLKPDYIERGTGHKFKKVLKKRTMEQIMNGVESVEHLVPIDHKMKNKDMALIPHPFDVQPGQRVVMIDPMDQRIRNLMELQNRGGADEVAELLQNKYLTIENTPLKRKGPAGVDQIKLRYKFKG